MRHGNKNNALSRKKAHRDALLSNLACSLIAHKRINTTLAKARALRRFVEPLITKSRTDSTHSRRTGSIGSKSSMNGDTIDAEPPITSASAFEPHVSGSVHGVGYPSERIP